MCFKYVLNILVIIYVCRWVNSENLDRPCIPRDFGRGSIVCICNSTYCDSIGDVENGNSGSGNSDEGRGQIYIYTSSKLGQRFQKSKVQFNSNGNEDPEDYIPGVRGQSNRNSRFFGFFDRIGDFPRPNRVSKFTIRREKRYQKIIGWGGAFTDAAGLNIAKLSEGAQENLMKSYFGPDSIDYNLCRVPIGGTDFSARPYTYNDVSEPDRNLTHFKLQPEDFSMKIPYIRWAETLSEQKIRLIASPWSAPVWMKTNKKLNGAGMLRKEYYQDWAQYFARFLVEYKNEGINIWAVTTGNEPLNGFIPRFPFNCMGWRATDCRDWIANNLGPTLRSLNVTDGLDVKIVIFDDNKGALTTWAKEILGNRESAQYVSGMGTHWYLDFLTGSEVLTRVHNDYPDYFIIQTEACLGFAPWEIEKVILGSWTRAESYMEAILRDQRNWASGFIDWNLALDLTGGPNWAKLSSDAAILVNSEKDEFYKQPIYYAIGHVSKFVPPDSVRIDMTGIQVPRNLQYIAFQRPDQSIVLIFLNKLSYDAKVSLYDEQRGNIYLNIPAKSMQTMIYY